MVRVWEIGGDSHNHGAKAASTRGDARLLFPNGMHSVGSRERGTVPQRWLGRCLLQRATLFREIGFESAPLTVTVKNILGNTTVNWYLKGRGCVYSLQLSDNSSREWTRKGFSPTLVVDTKWRGANTDNAVWKELTLLSLMPVRKDGIMLEVW